MTDTRELAQVLATKTFCPDCHRLMEAISTMEVPGVGKVAVDFKCHYCEEQWTTNKGKSREHCSHGVLLLRDCATCTDDARTTETILDELLDHRKKYQPQDT